MTDEQIEAGWASKDSDGNNTGYGTSLDGWKRAVRWALASRSPAQAPAPGQAPEQPVDPSQALRSEPVAADGVRAALAAEPGYFNIALNTMHPKCHEAAKAFWDYWEANGETHKHGYYESTWGAINRALRLVGTKPHQWS